MILSPRNRVARVCLLMCLVLGCATIRAVETKADPVDPELERMAQRVLWLVNQHRTAEGLAPLVMDSTLSAHARAYSQKMAKGEIRFCHDGFRERMTPIREGMGYSVAGENLQRNNNGKEPVEEAMKGWLASSGHRTNMEFDYSKTGIGVARSEDGMYYFTEIFIQQNPMDVQISFSK